MTVSSFLWSVSGPKEGKCHLVILVEGGHVLLNATAAEVAAADALIDRVLGNINDKR